MCVKDTMVTITVPIADSAERAQTQPQPPPLAQPRPVGIGRREGIPQTASALSAGWRLLLVLLLVLSLLRGEW